LLDKTALSLYNGIMFAAR